MPMQVLGEALIAGKTLTNGVDSMPVLKHENAMLRKHIESIKAIDDEEIDRLYNRMGMFLPRSSYHRP